MLRPQWEGDCPDPAQGLSQFGKPAVQTGGVPLGERPAHLVQAILDPLDLLVAGVPDADLLQLHRQISLLVWGHTDTS